MIGFSPSAISTLNESEFFIQAPNSTNSSTIIHMDLDLNFLPLPSVVKASIFESFARQNLAESETDVGSGIKQLVKSRYGYPIDALSDIICGNSCLALFNKLVLSCINEKGTFLFPMCSNGHYMSAAQFMKCNTCTIPTKEENGFKLLPEALRDALKSVERPWVYISGPTVNPSGSVYSDREINGLLTVCAEYGARVVIDTSFSGLEFGVRNGSSIWNLKQSICNPAGSQKSSCIILLGGLSFELLASGFDFGFLLLNEPDPDLVESVGNLFRGLSRPHGISKYAVRKLLGLKNGADKRLLQAIEEENESLRSHAGALTKV
jgi:methionine S-methyltransferase